MMRICQLCADTHLANYHCTQCEEDMCEIGKIAHQKSKASKDHTIIEIQESREKELRKTILITGICSVHNDAYRYYDEICCTRICRDCFALNHYGHRCISIEEGMNEKKRLCEEKYVKEIVRETEDYERVIKEAGEKKKELDNQYEEAKTVIQSNFKKLRESLDIREKELLEEVNHVYTKHERSFDREQEQGKTLLKELQDQAVAWKNALETVVINTSSTIAPTKATVQEINQLFALYEGLLGKETALDTRRIASKQLLLDWMSIAKFTIVIDTSELNNLMERIGKIGAIIEGETSAEHCEGEGEGLQKYENKDAEFVVTTYYGNGVKKTIGGDVISLILGEKDEKGKELTEFERSVQANVIDEKNGIYRVKWRSMSAGLEGEIGLHVLVNWKDIKGSPFQVQFPSLPKPPPPPLPRRVELLDGKCCSITADGTFAKGTAGSGNSWCQINPIPLEQFISLRLFLGSSNIARLYFFEVENVVNGCGNYTAGQYTWTVALGEFYESTILKATNKKPITAGSLISFQLSTSTLACYLNNELLHTFTVKDRLYKVAIYVYSKEGTVELIR